MIAPAKPPESWEEFWSEGIKYARLCDVKVKHFTNEIRYNIAGMAVEKLVMGFLMHRHLMPDGHTLRDLMDALENELPSPGDLYPRIRQMDDFQQICAFDTYTRTVPNDREMTGIVACVHELNSHLKEQVK